MTYYQLKPGKPSDDRNLKISICSSKNEVITDLTATGQKCFSLRGGSVTHNTCVMVTEDCKPFVVHELYDHSLQGDGLVNVFKLITVFIDQEEHLFYMSYCDQATATANLFISDLLIAELCVGLNKPYKYVSISDTYQWLTTNYSRPIPKIESGGSIQWNAKAGRHNPETKISVLKAFLTFLSDSKVPMSYIECLSFVDINKLLGIGVTG